MVDKLSYCEGKLCVLQYSMLLPENKWIFTKFFHNERFVKLLKIIYIAAISANLLTPSLLSVL